MKTRNLILSFTLVLFTSSVWASKPGYGNANRNFKNKITRIKGSSAVGSSRASCPYQSHNVALNSPTAAKQSSGAGDEGVTTSTAR